MTGKHVTTVGFRVDGVVVVVAMVLMWRWRLTQREYTGMWEPWRKHAGPTQETDRNRKRNTQKVERKHIQKDKGRTQENA